MSSNEQIVTPLATYTKLRQVGAGASGVVFLVHCETNGVDYVMKALDMNKFSPKDIENAMAEVTVLRSLDHPNIIHHRESWVDESSNHLYIIMEYADGGDLNELVVDQRKKKRYFTKEEVIDMFVQICLAVKHMHDRRIMHRDIKLQNIFITSGGVIKLGDFGLTCVLKDTLSNAQTCLGTPYYMSPELCLNESYNYKSDIWALGCVLYKLCSLQHAFPAQSFKELQRAILEDPTPEVPKGYGKRLGRLVECLLMKSPDDRPKINEVLQASILVSRIPVFLDADKMADEMSHTTIRPREANEEDPSGPVDTRRDAGEHSSDASLDDFDEGRATEEADDSERAFNALQNKLAEIGAADRGKDKDKAKSTHKHASKEKEKGKGKGKSAHMEGLEELRQAYLAKKAE